MDMDEKIRGKETDRDSLLYKFMDDFGREHPDIYVKLWEAADKTSGDLTNESTAKEIKNILEQNGRAYHVVKNENGESMVLYCRKKDKNPGIIHFNLNKLEGEKYTWEKIAMAVYAIAPNVVDARRSWEEKYGKDFPEGDVEPVQQNENRKKKWENPEIEEPDPWKMEEGKL